MPDRNPTEPGSKDQRTKSRNEAASFREIRTNSKSRYKYKEPDRKCVFHGTEDRFKDQAACSRIRETRFQETRKQDRNQKNLGTMQFQRPGGKIPGTMYKGTKDSRKMGVPGTGGTDLRNQKA